MSTLILIGLCLLPGIIASSRGHHNAGAIWAVSILLGWSGIGWIAALIWSLTSTHPRLPQQIIINNNNQLGQPPLVNNQVVDPDAAFLPPPGGWYKGSLVEKTPASLTADEAQMLQLYRRQRQEEARLAAFGNLGGAGADKSQPASQLAPEPEKKAELPPID